MAVEDWLAGAFDVAATPLDVISLLEALPGTVRNLSQGKENPFARALAETETGFLAQSLRDKVTDITGSDPESEARRNVTDTALYGLDLLTGASGAKVGTAAKLAKKAVREGSKKAALESARKAADAVAHTAVTNAIANAAFNTMFDTDPSQVDSAVNSLAIAATPFYGVRQLRKLARNTQALNDIADHSTREMRQKYNRASTRQNLYDANGAIMDKFQADDLTRGMSDTDILSSYNTIEKVVPMEGPVSKLHDMLKKFNRSEKKQDILRYLQEESEYEQRIAAPKTKALNELRDSADLEPGMQKVIIDDIADRLNLSGEFKTIEDLEQAIRSMDRKALQELMASKPSLFPATGYIGENGLPISNEQLYENLKKHQKEFADEFGPFSSMWKEIAKEDNNLNFKAGMITKEEYLRTASKAETEGYIPKAEASKTGVDLSGQPSKMGSYMQMSADEMGGVRQQVNTFRHMAEVINNHGLSRAMNDRRKSLFHSLQKNIPLARKSYVDREAKIVKELRTNSDKIRRQELIQDLEFIRSRIKHLDEYKFSKEAGESLTPGAGQTKIEFMEGGIPREMLVPNDDAPVFKFRERNASSIVRGLQATNNFALQFRTGKWNPAFWARKYVYGLLELPALITEAKKRGLDMSYGRVMFEQARQFKNELFNNYYNYIIDSLEAGSAKKFGYTLEDVPTLKGKLKESLKDKYFVSPVDNFAEFTRSGSDALFDLINPDTPLKMNRLSNAMNRAWNFVDRSMPAQILSIFNSAISDSAAATIVAIANQLFDPKNFANKEAWEKAILEYVRDVSRHTSDTTRRGLGRGALGEALNLIQDVMPYGRSAVQGLAGKLQYTNLLENKDKLMNMLSDTRRLTNGNWDYGAEVVTRIGAMIGEVTQGETFDMLLKVVGIPTAITYFWNNMTPEQSRDYHNITPMNRGKQRILLNAGGKGVHAYFPMDQEWAVLSSIFEAMLDSVFGLSELDASDPAFSYRQQIADAAGRALGIEFPVVINAAIKGAGYQTNLTAEPLIGDGSFIEQVYQNKNDAIPTNIANVIGEFTGAIGSMLNKLANNKPNPISSMFQMPLVSGGFNTSWRNETAKYVDANYGKFYRRGEFSTLMSQRRKLQKKLSLLYSTGRDENGHKYDKSIQDVSADINNQIAELNATMYHMMKEEDGNQISP